MLSIRTAASDELDWVNARYAEIDFLPSAAGDLIAIASSDGEDAGLGRIVPAGPSVGELGGMFVFERFQGLGLAKRIVAYLQQHSPFPTLYCLPFAELEALYAAMGFVRVEVLDGVPEQVAHKHRWCNQHYPKPVLLMRTEIGDRPRFPPPGK